MAPMITFILACLAWAVIPVADGWAMANLNVGVLYLFAISSLGVYGVIIAGWASNSKYAFLGALRSAAQMVSYEVSIGFVLVSVLLCVGSLNLNEVVKAQSHIWFCVPMFPMFVVFLISMLAETNRSPFDLPEGESEIVAGFFVEYSAMAFALFYLGEYTNMIMMSALASILFLGGWLAPFGLTFIPGTIWLIAKICLVMFFFFWVRATFPRYRYDQLMRLGWKVFPAAVATVARADRGFSGGVQHAAGSARIMMKQKGQGALPPGPPLGPGAPDPDLIAGTPKWGLGTCPQRGPGAEPLAFLKKVHLAHGRQHQPSLAPDHVGAALRHGHHACATSSSPRPRSTTRTSAVY